MQVATQITLSVHQKISIRIIALVHNNNSHPKSPPVSSTTKLTRRFITDLSRRNKFVPVQQGSSLSQAFEIIAQRGVHRVPVVDSHGQVVNIISQSSIINFLSTHVSFHRALQGVHVCFNMVLL